MREASAFDLIDSYDAFFLDAYGVLVQSSGALPGAIDFIRELRRRGKKVRVVSNDASRTPETCVSVYARRGFDFTVDEFLIAGLAIEGALQRNGVVGGRCAVLGTSESQELVRRAGGTPIAITADSRFDAVVVCDDSGFDFLPTMNALLSSLHRSLGDGHRPTMLLTNPDLLYPVADRAFGFTSGSLGAMLDKAVSQLHPGVTLDWQVLGKPSKWLFEMALRSTGVAASGAVMFGDQLATDVAGANAVGVASAIVTTGITKWPLPADASPRPTYVIRSLAR